MQYLSLILVSLLLPVCSSQQEVVDERSSPKETKGETASDDLVQVDVSSEKEKLAASVNEGSAPEEGEEEVEDSTPETPLEEAAEEVPPVDPSDTSMSFFVTSSGVSGNGDLGGLAGADAFCNSLAEAQGAPGNWRAYLSTTTEDGAPLVNARERIGTGPWYNQAGQKLTDNVESLHNTAIPIALFLNELGELTRRNAHDILTGSDAQGMAVPENCSNWTSSQAEDSGIVGHVDLRGGPLPTQSWVAQHPTPCDNQGMSRNAGRGHLYCFRVP